MSDSLRNPRKVENQDMNQPESQFLNVDIGNKFYDSLNKEEYDPLGNLNMENFNSRKSGINREIPKEALKIVDDLFDDSVTKRDIESSQISNNPHQGLGLVPNHMEEKKGYNPFDTHIEEIVSDNRLTFNNRGKSMFDNKSQAGDQHENKQISMRNDVLEQAPMPSKEDQGFNLFEQSPQKKPLRNKIMYDEFGLNDMNNKQNENTLDIQYQQHQQNHPQIQQDVNQKPSGVNKSIVHKMIYDESGLSDRNPKQSDRREEYKKHESQAVSEAVASNRNNSKKYTNENIEKLDKIKPQEKMEIVEKLNIEQEHIQNHKQPYKINLNGQESQIGKVSQYSEIYSPIKKKLTNLTNMTELMVDEKRQDDPDFQLGSHVNMDDKNLNVINNLRANLNSLEIQQQNANNFDFDKHTANQNKSNNNFFDDWNGEWDFKNDSILKNSNTDIYNFNNSSVPPSNRQQIYMESQTFIKEDKPEVLVPNYDIDLRKNLNLKGNDDQVPTDIQKNVQNVMEKNKGINFDDILNNVNFKEAEQNQKKSENFIQVDSDKINPVHVDDDIGYINQYINQNEIDLASQQDQYQEFVGKIIQFSIMKEKDKPYGKSKIGKESKEKIIERKSTFIKDNYFSNSKNGHIQILEKLNSQNLPSYLNLLDEEALNIQIQMIFEDMLMNSTDLDDIKLLLSKFKIDITINLSPIGPLTDIIYDDSYKVIKDSLKDIIRNFKGKRQVLSDGNGFYRAFMFSLIERHILNKDTFNIKKIVFDFNEKINTMIFKRKDMKEEANKNVFNAVFYNILDNLESNRIKEAYVFFIKAFHKFTNFDQALIKYMRIALYSFFKANSSKIDTLENAVILYSLLPSTYLTNEGYSFKHYFEDCLLSMQYEADHIALILAPIVFNINIDLHIIEGSMSSNPSYLKHTYHCLLGENKLNNFAQTISIMFKFNQYEILYSHSIMNEFESVIPFSFYDKSMIHDLTTKRIYIIEELPCEICGRTGEFIQLCHMPGVPLCKLCLQDFIKSVIKDRTKFFTNEHSINKECNKNI